MKKSVKIALILARSAFLIGACLSFAALYLLQFNFSTLSTEKAETNMHEISAPFHSLSIEVDTADVRLLPAEDGVCTVICTEGAKTRHAVAIRDDTLYIEANDDRAWYEYVGIFSFGSTSVTLYLPETDYRMLEAETSTGDVEVPDVFTFDSAEVETDTGDIDWEADVHTSLSLGTDTGKIAVASVQVGTVLSAETDTGRMEFTDVQCEDMRTEAHTGNVYLQKAVVADSLKIVTTTGDVTLTDTAAAGELDIQTDTGDVLFNNADAGQIRVHTSTGDVKGTLKTEKIFFTQTDTGRVNIPRTTTGGSCEIETDTGDINIRLTDK